MTLKETWKMIEDRVKEENSRFSDSQDGMEVAADHIEPALIQALGGIEVDHPKTNSFTDSTSVLFTITDIDFVKIMLDRFTIFKDGTIFDASNPLQEIDEASLYSILSELVLQYFYHIVIHMSLDSIARMSLELELLQKKRPSARNRKDRKLFDISSVEKRRSLNSEIQLLKRCDKVIIENNIEFLGRIEQIMRNKAHWLTSAKACLESGFIQPHGLP
jgi:hypothetical protein